METSATTFSREEIEGNIRPLSFYTKLKDKQEIVGVMPHIGIGYREDILGLYIHDCFDRFATRLPTFPFRLSVLILNNTLLEELPVLPDFLKHFICSGNAKLKRINNFPMFMRNITILDNIELEYIPDLPVDLKHFICGNNPKLTVVPMLPFKLHTLMYAHPIWSTSLPEIPDTVTYLKLRRMPTHLPSKLSFLICDYDISLQKLPSLPDTLKNLAIRRCPSLSILPKFPPALESFCIHHVGPINFIHKIPRSVNTFCTDMPLIGIPPNNVVADNIGLSGQIIKPMMRPVIRFCLASLRDLALAACIRYQKDIQIPELADYIGTMSECYFCPRPILGNFVMVVEMNRVRRYRQCNLYCGDCWRRAAKTTERVQVRSEILPRFLTKDSNLVLLEYLQLLSD